MKLFLARILSPARCPWQPRVPPFPPQLAEPQSSAPTSANRAQQPAAQRQGHLFPLHRRKRPDHHAGSAIRSPAPSRRPHRHRRRAPGRHLHRLRHGRASPHRRAAIAVRALVTVRNDGKSPLARIPLQISSSLNWERIRVSAATSPSRRHAQLRRRPHRPVARGRRPAPTPLAPGQSIQLDVTYSGAIAQSAQRLLVIGTPKDVALRTPIGMKSASLHRPARLRQRGLVSGLQRPRHPRRRRAPLRRDGRAQAAHGRRAIPPSPHRRVSPRPAPTVALINGHPAPLTVTSVDSRPGNLRRRHGRRSRVRRSRF
jgi:hypothetical protein